MITIDEAIAYIKAQKTLLVGGENRMEEAAQCLMIEVQRMREFMVRASKALWGHEYDPEIMDQLAEEAGRLGGINPKAKRPKRNGS